MAKPTSIAQRSKPPAEVFGALREGLHLAGYSFERACTQLDYLLTDGLWKQCGEFDGDVNKFLASISLADFRKTVDQRQSITRKIAAIEAASQRQIAKTLGVGLGTVQRDLGKAPDPTGSPAQETPNETKGSESESDPTGSPAPVFDGGPSKEPPPPDSGRDAVKRLAEKDKRPRSGNASHDNDDEWYTPPGVVEACRYAMGEIDLDPASNERANRVVRATRFFGVEDDGLAQRWSGRVFLNPPYSRQAGKADFLEKLSGEVVAGRVTQACVVLSYDFSAAWFEPLRPLYSAICLFRGRVQFYKVMPGDGHDPALGTSVVYIGPDVERFAGSFSPIGDVVVPYAR